MFVNMLDFFYRYARPVEMTLRKTEFTDTGRLNKDNVIKEKWTILVVEPSPEQQAQSSAGLVTTQWVYVYLNLNDFNESKKYDVITFEYQGRVYNVDGKRGYFDLANPVELVAEREVKR